jgi:hypothetical protein
MSASQHLSVNWQGILVAICSWISTYLALNVSSSVIAGQARDSRLLFDFDWWSSSLVIHAHRNGRISLCSIGSQLNLLSHTTASFSGMSMPPM